MKKTTAYYCPFDHITKSWVEDKPAGDKYHSLFLWEGIDEDQGLW